MKSIENMITDIILSGYTGSFKLTDEQIQDLWIQYCIPKVNFGRYISTRQIEAIDLAFYKFAVRCFNDGLNIAFKGGCLIRHILRNVGHTDLRYTKDIDFDLCEYTYLKLIEYYTTLVRIGKLRDDMKCNAVLLDGPYDCDLKIVSNFRLDTIIIYECPIGNFIGVRLEDILADKITSLSSKLITARVKDIIDVHKFITNKDILKEIQIPLLRIFIAERKIGDFKIIKEKPKELIKALSYFTNKPDDVIKTCLMFINGVLGTNSIIWNGRVWL